MNFKSIENTTIENKRILLRVDFNIIDITDNTIKHIKKIKDSLPTIHYLLKNQNKLILISHSSDDKTSLKPVAEILQNLLPNNPIIFINNFTQEDERRKIDNQNENEIIFLENIRFFDGEKANDPEFTKKLSELGEIYVNESFGTDHRKHASTWGLSQILPSYAGIHLINEVNTLLKATNHPERPLTVIIGGKKISTKIRFINVLLEKADHILIGGALANTLLAGQDIEIGNSLYEPELLSEAKKILNSPHKDKLVLPTDVRIDQPYSNVPVTSIPSDAKALDIGEETEQKFIEIIRQSETVVWNGPLGMFENEKFAHGTQSIFAAMAQNTHAVTIIGGGDTLPAIKHLDGKTSITHISTGGGAMLELIEKGSLPCLEALSE